MISSYIYTLKSCFSNILGDQDREAGISKGYGFVIFSSTLRLKQWIYLRWWCRWIPEPLCCCLCSYLSFLYLLCCYVVAGLFLIFWVNFLLILPSNCLLKFLYETYCCSYFLTGFVRRCDILAFLWDGFSSSSHNYDLLDCYVFFNVYVVV